MDKVNQVIEATPLLTEKVDVKSLNQLAYAATMTVIKTGLAENDCIIRKQNITRRKEDRTFNMNWRIIDLHAKISKISQKNDTRPSPKMKQNTNLLKTKYQIFDKQRRSISLETSSVYVPLTIDSSDSKGGKNNTSGTTTL